MTEGYLNLDKYIVASDLRKLYLTFPKSETLSHQLTRRTAITIKQVA